MITTYKKAVKLEWLDFSGGVNLSDKPWKLRKNQVQYAIDAILRKNGIERRPGTLVLTSFDLTSTVEGLHIYRQLAGTEKLLTVCGGVVSELDTTTGADSERYTLTGAGDAYLTDYLDKCWIANGTKCCKVENETGYQIGITAPTGATAAKLAGGTLPDGKYSVYITYARRVDGTNRLHSVFQSVGDVTLSGADNSIRISTFTDSADGQVGNKCVFLIEPDGSVAYFYYETEDNETETLDITSADDKNEDIVLSVVSANNLFPGDGTIPAFEFIHAFDGRLWGSSANVLYYSLRNVSNVFDLERFFPFNKNTYGFDIEGIFSIGDFLYLNTKDGIIKQPTDTYEKGKIVDARWYFYHMNTVKKYRNGVIGLTNDGVKFFDGDHFFDYDISYPIRSEIEKIYSSTSGFSPCGAIYRRDIRTEYHLSYNDDDKSSTSNNSRLVLNLNMLQFLPDKKVVAPWELWSNGANHIAVDSSENMYNAQSHATLPKVYKENTGNTIDNGIYLNDGKVGDSDSKIPLLVKTNTQMVDIKAMCCWEDITAIIRQAEISKITLVYPDFSNRAVETTFGMEDVTLWDDFIWDVDVWDWELLSPRFKGLPMLYGYMAYVKIEQTADDKNYNVGDITIEGIAEKNQFT